MDRDHRATFEAATDAAGQAGTDLRCYEAGRLLKQNLRVNASAVQNQKTVAMVSFAS